jgi:hypothetical protein
MNRSLTLLCVLHLFGNALLLWLGYYWLGIGEGSGLQLAWSTLVILFFICSAVWLHGTAFALFDTYRKLSLSTAARSALNHLAPLFVIAICAAAVYGLLAYWHNHFAHQAFVIASWATMQLRKPIRPASVLRWFHVLIWILRWLVVPVLFFPLAASAATLGWRGLRWNFFRHSKWILYAAAVCLLLLCAIWVPLKLVAWVPEIPRFPLQMASFVARIGLGYLLFVAALLSIEFLTSAGKPRLSQSNTVASP